MAGKCQDVRADTIVAGLHGPSLRDSLDTAYQALLYAGAEFGVTFEHLRAKRFGVHWVNISEPKEGRAPAWPLHWPMLSAANGRPVQRRVAVTGELSVHGNVNAVGGIAEKPRAAARHGRQLVVVPVENASELGRLTEIASGLDIPSGSIAEGSRGSRPRGSACAPIRGLTGNGRCE